MADLFRHMDFGCVTHESHSLAPGSAFCVFVTYEEAVAAVDLIMDDILLLRENGRWEGGTDACLCIFANHRNLYREFCRP